MMTKDPSVHLAYILESIDAIVAYVEGNNKDLFLSDQKTYDAVLHRLHTLAESTMVLPQEWKERWNTVDWKGIAGLRHVLVHEYLGTVKNDRIWQVIVDRLPELKALLLKIEEAQP